MGLPHSEIHGSSRICRSPWLIAAYHVLLRLLAPRHPSCTLCSLINPFPLWCDRRLLKSGRPGKLGDVTETLVLFFSAHSHMFVSGTATAPLLCLFQTSSSQRKLYVLSTTTLYVDVKEPARPEGPAESCRIRSLREKEAVNLSIYRFTDLAIGDLRLRRRCLRPPGQSTNLSINKCSSGRDRIRTCDPALIKRML